MRRKPIQLTGKFPRATSANTIAAIPVIPAIKPPGLINSIKIPTNPIASRISAIFGFAKNCRNRSRNPGFMDFITRSAVFNSIAVLPSFITYPSISISSCCESSEITLINPASKASFSEYALALVTVSS